MGPWNWSLKRPARRWSHARIRLALLRTSAAAADDALLHVRFQDAEGLFVPLYRHVERLEHPLGRKVVSDNPLLDFDRLGWHAERLGVESEIENQLLRRSGDAAEIGVQADGVLVVYFDPLAPLLLLGGGLAGGLGVVGWRLGGLIFLFGHDWYPVVGQAFPPDMLLVEQVRQAQRPTYGSSLRFSRVRDHPLAAVCNA